MARLLPFLSLLIVRSNGNALCDDLDSKCTGECNSLHTDFVSFCVKTLLSMSSCPPNCKESYEGLLAYQSSTEPNIGQQYATCTCHPSGSFCSIRSGTLQSCQFNSSTEANVTTQPPTSTANIPTRQPGCVHAGAACLMSNSCRLVVEDVEQHCLGNSSDNANSNTTCSVQCRVRILAGQRDVMWRELEMCSPWICPTKDSTCERIHRLKTVVDRCNVTASSTVDSTQITSHHSSESYSTVHTSIRTKNPSAGCTMYSHMTDALILVLVFILLTLM
ncbi:uncharacterized protein LOC134194123 [Corticium candelabrum]|uniref:uncharacterized protein LOC134194123 n=1 Tax=Corticium candelabrum TaxID=121492 RepID=UPI002E26C8E3|nr:uncharacterized protein LOC134194123 [Corticium candelabrum]